MEKCPSSKKFLLQLDLGQKKLDPKKKVGPKKSWRQLGWTRPKKKVGKVGTECLSIFHFPSYDLTASHRVFKSDTSESWTGRRVGDSGLGDVSGQFR